MIERKLCNNDSSLKPFLDFDFVKHKYKMLPFVTAVHLSHPFFL